jgi:hypothetical protein
MMTDPQNLMEYEKLALDLPHIQPYKGCCSTPLVETIHVEPLAGRNPLTIARTCVVQCPECGNMYLCNWDL